MVASKSIGVYLLAITLALSAGEAFAMGQAPSTCPNRYDGPIVSAMIVANGTAYDPMAQQDLTFTLPNDMTYDVTFTIHTNTQSSQNNTDPGTTWYRNTALGFGNGICVNDAGPGQDITITSSYGHPPAMAPEGTQSIEFGTVSSTGFQYNVEWVNPINNTSTPQLQTLTVISADSSGTAFEGMWTELWQNGQIIQEGPTPFSAEVQSGTDYEVFMGNWENILFDHWEDGSTNPQRAFSISENTTFTAFFRINNPPNAEDDSAQTTINQPVTIDVLANDSDPDGDPLTVDSTSQPMHGSVTINEDNTITYTPDLAFIGSDSFDYQISDGIGQTDAASVFITVGIVEIPPLPILP